MDNTLLLNTILAGALLANTTTVLSETVIPVKENAYVAIHISKDNYNRLLVENDKIVKLRFPEKHLSVEHDNDGSVYLDALDDRPFTLFVTTKEGRHFSAIVTVSDSPGETIRFTAKEASPTAVAIKDKPKDRYAEQMKTLVSAAEQEQAIAGFKVNAVQVKPLYLKPSLKAELAFSLSNEKHLAQKFLLTNRSSKPIHFDQRWFKDNKTLALLTKSAVIYPNESVDVIRVLEVSHG